MAATVTETEQWKKLKPMGSIQKGNNSVLDTVRNVLIRGEAD